MATRSLTEVFILLRNNALQNRHIFSDQNGDDQMALVSKDGDVELGSSFARLSRLPPEWIDNVEEVQFEISKIKGKMKDLSTLHDRHLNRPTLDDNMAEEHAIEIQTREITQMFGHCQHLVQKMSARSRGSTKAEQKLTQNIVASLVRTLQELSTNFKQSQSTYLRKFKSREERSRQYFGDEEFGFGDTFDTGFTAAQLQLVEDNAQLTLQREKEISQIVKSIHDLNEIFKDLASMVVDQGSILDRIDYNIEHTAVQVEKGLEHLQKAEKYQKKNRKMMIIVVLFVVVIVLIILLVAVKSIS